jgi:hypothetical protein
MAPMLAFLFAYREILSQIKIVADFVLNWMKNVAGLSK